MIASPHLPVMLKEVLHYLAPQKGHVYVDGTFGVGGYTQALLDAAPCKVYSIDCDPAAKPFAKKLKEKYADRFTFLAGRFGEMKTLLADHHIDQVDGITLDLGVSSIQLDQAERGFSFRFEGPLDMRMSREGLSAADVVNTLDEKDLADIIFHYGEERFSRRIAKKIVEERKISPLTTTQQLATLIRTVVRRSHDGIDPATRTFQALRIYVNDELKELERGLEAAETLLAPGGRLAVVSFHSLEDRIVKKFLKSKSDQKSSFSRHAPPKENLEQPVFTLLHGRVIKPGPEECTQNPRARSARLRAGEKIKQETSS